MVPSSSMYYDAPICWRERHDAWSDESGGRHAQAPPPLRRPCDLCERRVRQRRQHDVAIPSEIAVTRNDRARVRPSATDTSIRLPTVDAPTGRVLSMTQSLAAHEVVQRDVRRRG